uniref:Uncharacterized protein n=1 Tax=Anguilla anguilla TaxID=7936 RepID=A0A0E9T0H4_ANGAN
MLCDFTLSITRFPENLHNHEELCVLNLKDFHTSTNKEISSNFEIEST